MSTNERMDFELVPGTKNLYLLIVLYCVLAGDSRGRDQEKLGWSTRKVEVPVRNCNQDRLRQIVWFEIEQQINVYATQLCVNACNFLTQRQSISKNSS